MGDSPAGDAETTEVENSQAAAPAGGSGAGDSGSDDPGGGISGGNGSGSDGNIQAHDIQDEMRTSYLTYAMSVIVSRALPDVRDGLKPSQRRILVAMNDLNLSPGSSTTKCAGIVGETMKRYHPHGDGAIYPTLARMAQEWVMRDRLVHPQGNFGSLAGLPPAQMRYTEARLSSIAAEMLEDINRDTVDYVANYDQKGVEPVVLPGKFPNLVVNGSSGIAVGMATSIPPHNLNEACDALITLIDNPEAGIDDILEVMPAPDFPTGGVICGRYGVRQGYMTGRSTLTLRARTHFEKERNADVIVVTEIPYQETRDRVREKLELVAREDKVKGISRVIDLTDRTIPRWQVRLHIVLKRDADPEVVLNQLYKFSSLQTTVSVILLALVAGRPQTLTIIELLQEFLRHRVDVIRRRTEYLLSEARRRKHTVEGLLVAQIDIDQIIQTIRDSASRAEAKDRLQQIDVPRELIERALGPGGFADFLSERGEQDIYHLSANQSEAIVSMQLGSLANLERENLQGEHRKLLEDITGFLHLLSDEAHIRAVVREDLETLKNRFGSPRRTGISEEELSDVDPGDLIAEEPMVVTISTRGYVKRTQLSVYQAQHRGGKGVRGAGVDEDDPIEHLFVSSSHAWLLFFTDRGRVYWRKVYELPLQGRTARGRALVNLLQLKDGEERVATCRAVMTFPDDWYLMIATSNGLVKKSPLSAYARPMRGGIIAINLDEDDELIDVQIVSETDDVVLATRDGMSIRFSQEDARSMGRNTRGVKGIKLSSDDRVVGMVITDMEYSLLTVCENGYGKRTPFGPGELANGDSNGVGDENDSEATAESDNDVASDDAPSYTGNMRYRRQRRGGKGLRDIRTTSRNGKVIDILAVSEHDDVLMVTARGKIQRIHAAAISQVGRNTMGVRCIRLDESDKLVSMARIPVEIKNELDAPEAVPLDPEEPEVEETAPDDSEE